MRCELDVYRSQLIRGSLDWHERTSRHMVWIEPEKRPLVLALVAAGPACVLLAVGEA